MSDLTLQYGQAESPFDAIKQRHIDGSEFWSARDLLSPLGYDTWRNFAAAIERSKIAIQNSGEALTSHVADASKLLPRPQGGSVRTEDFHLSRYGAYMTVMNGDPRKPEVAAAQAYFAIRTREAETIKPALTEDELIHQALAITSRRVQALTERVAVLEPKAEVADRLLTADGDLSVGDAAKALQRAGVDTGQNRLFREMQTLRWIYRSEGGWSPYQTAVNAGHLTVLPQTYVHPRTGERVLGKPSIRVTPKGLQKLMSAISMQALAVTA